jgi:hypothetical protein
VRGLIFPLVTGLALLASSSSILVYTVPPQRTRSAPTPSAQREHELPAPSGHDLYARYVEAAYRPAACDHLGRLPTLEECERGVADVFALGLFEQFLREELIYRSSFGGGADPFAARARLDAAEDALMARLDEVSGYSGWLWLARMRRGIGR